MGAYTSLCLDDFDLCVSKNAVIPEVMTVFRESDRRKYRRRMNYDEREDIELSEDDCDFEDVIEYATNVANACQRLDVMGFTLQRAEREFERIRQELLEGTREAIEEDGGASKTADTLYAEDLERYSRLTFGNFVVAFRDVVARQLKWYDLTPNQREALNATTKYILENNDDWLHFGFFCNDVRCFLRMALSLAQPDSVVHQDVPGMVCARMTVPS